MNNYCEFGFCEKKTNKNPKILTKKQIKRYQTEITSVNVNSKKIAKLLEKDEGVYTTIHCKDFDFLTNEHFDFLTEIVIREIKKILNLIKIKLDNSLKIFIVGLGNKNITADSLGSLAANKVISTNFELEKNNISNKYFANIISLAPSVTSNNGIYTATLIKSICNDFKPNLVVLIDSLSCKNVSYLGKTFQLSSSGLTPGCEVGLQQPKLNKKLLKSAVLTIGCPLVCSVKNINTSLCDNRFLTLKDIDIVVKKCADIISYSLNKCFHSLKKDEILFLSKE